MNHEEPEHHHEHAEVPGGVHPERHGERESPVFRRWWVGGWLAPLLVTAGTLIWVFLIYWLIGDRETVWKYGVVPYVPGSSIFAIEGPDRGEVPPKVMLPEDDSEDMNAER